MKKNLVIIRFGLTAPLKKEIVLIMEKIVAPEDADLAVGGAFHDMGLISIVRSQLEPREVARLFEEVAAETGDILPVIVIDLDSDAAGLHLADIQNFSKLVRDFQALLAEQGGDQPTKVSMTLDELLDLANRKGGVDQLNTEERELLEKLSKNF